MLKRNKAPASAATPAEAKDETDWEIRSSSEKSISRFCLAAQDTEEKQDLPAKYEVTNLPTVFFFKN